SSRPSYSGRSGPRLGRAHGRAVENVVCRRCVGRQRAFVRDDEELVAGAAHQHAARDERGAGASGLRRLDHATFAAVAGVARRSGGTALAARATFAALTARATGAAT